MADGGMKDQVTGRLKQAEGDLTGDKMRKLQGKIEEKKGEAKKKVDDATD
jgi:uncharacterized protein YjbJ (UPF0337 family)